jgi:hypothetical protein
MENKIIATWKTNNPDDWLDRTIQAIVIGLVLLMVFSGVGIN